MDLKQIQQELANTITGTQVDRVSEWIGAPKGMRPSEALEIYRRGHIARMTEALGETFETVWWVLGDDLFFSLCEDYLHKFPSRSYNLNDFGARFVDYLRQVRKQLPAPFLIDLADFEWQFQEVFHAKHTPLNASEILTQIRDLSTTRFSFSSASRVLEYPYAVYTLWQQRKSDPERSAELMWDTPQSLLLYRHSENVHVLRLIQTDYFILKGLCLGRSVGDVLAEASTRFPEMKEDTVSNLFEFLYHSEIISVSHV